MGQFTDGVLESLAPWNDQADAWATITAAYASMFEPVAQLVMPNGSPEDPISYRAGWENLLDVDNCPAQFLPFLSLFNGTDVPPGTPEADARAIIKAEANFSRGTLPAIIATAQRFLTGTQSVTVFERTAADGSTPDPYHFVLIVLTSEVTDAAQLTAAVNATKPGGVQWTLVQTSSWTIAQLEAAGYSNITTVESTFSTVSHAETDQVG